ncbi:MAG TPA: M56 family metallopeptidase [Chloroflexia bacterium]|nr:M56 family metallopeptidase [Chloroflexia bacterium]
MHTALIGVSVLLAGVGSWLCARLLAQATAWNSRRTLQLLGLLLPACVLSVLAAILIHFLAQVCFLTAPPLDVALTQLLIAVGALGLAGGLFLNLLRTLLLPWQVRHRTWAGSPALAARVQVQARTLGLQRVPQVRIAPDGRPWALVAHPLRPTLVLSTGLLALLDVEELDAVLGHELLHLRRGDLWWTVLAGILHDLLPFWGPTRRLYRLLRLEQELACDDGVIGASRRLALASALARVWQAGLGPGPAWRGTLTLVPPAPGRTVEARIRRLLDRSGSVAASPIYRALGAGGAVLGLILAVQIAATLWTMGQLQCDLHQFGMWATGMP